MRREASMRMVALCALPEVTGKQWQVIARQARSGEGLERLLGGHVDETTKPARQLASNLQAHLEDLDGALEEAADAIEQAAAVDARLITVLEEAYPANLREIYNLPPFLFVQGQLEDHDTASIAVVGTRSATEEGIEQARRLAGQLAGRDVTVVSGLAAGIDTAAHTATLEAGGRTLAIMGTGILRTYPSENEALRRRIVDSGQGAVLSQFWPTTPPSRKTFPIRNVVTSGISQGTVVVEASETSGAKMQARLAYEHGKAVFVLDTLVTHRPWARSYVQDGKALEVTDVDDVVSRLRSTEEIRDAALFTEQLALDIA